MKKLIATLLASVALLSLAACSGNGDNSTDSGTSASTTSTATTDADVGNSNGSTAVTIGYVGTHDSSYPSSTISNDFITQMMIYDKLFEVDDNTGDFTSRVLSSWEWTDNVTLRLTLKDGIYFSDGNQMTGEDVLFSLYNYISRGTTTDKYSYYQYIDFDKSYVDEDGMTVYVVWQMEYGPALKTLDCPVMEKTFTEAHDDSDEIWYTGPVGSGPYKVKECEIDHYVTYELRDDYWDSADYTYDCSEVTLKFYSDETAMYVDYQNGNLDVIYGISTNVCEQIESAGDQGTVQYVPNGDVSLLILNDDTPEMQDPAVREAIAYALDMDAIADIAYGRLSAHANSHFSSTFSCYVEHEGYSYDAEKAKQLLTDAGYADGDIVLDYIAVNMSPQPEVAEAVQGYLSTIGITVNVNSYDLGTALNIYIAGESDFCMLTVNGGNPTREPNLMMSCLVKDANFTCMGLDDATFNQYAETGLNSIDDSVRDEAYKNADNWLYENYYALPICETLSAYAYNDRIASFNQSSVGKSCIGNITLAD